MPSQNRETTYLLQLTRLRAPRRDRRYLRPGGLFFIEDVATGANRRNLQRFFGRPRNPPGFSPLVHNESYLDASVAKILREHDSFFVDTVVGHRAFERFRRQTREYVADRVDHNTHVLVIRKRREPRRRPVVVHRGTAAMNHPWALTNLERLGTARTRGGQVRIVSARKVGGSLT